MASPPALVIAFMAIFAFSVSVVAAADDDDCSTVVTSLMDCLSYVSDDSETPSPSKACCAGVVLVVKESPVCMCQALEMASSLGVAINHTRVLALPAACSVKAPTVHCNNAPAPSPVPSPVVTPPPSPGPSVAPSPPQPSPAGPSLPPSPSSPSPAGPSPAPCEGEDESQPPSPPPTPTAPEAPCEDEQCQPPVEPPASPTSSDAAKLASSLLLVLAFAIFSNLI